MPSIIRDPGEKYARLQPIYELFTRLSFGGDEKVWHTMVGISVSNWKTGWEEGIRVVFAQSKEDSLVPYWQIVDVKKLISAPEADSLEVVELDATGDHNGW